MWTIRWSTKPPAAAFRVSRSHLEQLRAASSDLASLAVLLYSLGGLHAVLGLTQFPHSDWPVFTLYDTDFAALRRQYNISARASLPLSEAANMFIEMRDFAMDMERTMIWTTSTDSSDLCILAIYRPPPSWLQQQTIEEVLEKWGNVGAREAELQWWLERAAVLVVCAEGAVRSCSGRVSWEEDCDGVVVTPV